MPGSRPARACTVSVASRTSPTTITSPSSVGRDRSSSRHGGQVVERADHVRVGQQRGRLLGDPALRDVEHVGAELVEAHRHDAVDDDLAGQRGGQLGQRRGVPGVGDGDDHQVRGAGDVGVDAAAAPTPRRPRRPRAGRGRRPRRPPRRPGRRRASPAAPAARPPPAGPRAPGPAGRCRRAPRRPVPPPRARPPCPRSCPGQGPPIMPGGAAVGARSPSQARSSASASARARRPTARRARPPPAWRTGPSRCRSAHPSRVSTVWCFRQ